MATTTSTRVAGVIGSPVRHSLSPALHNAAFAAAGLDWTFVAFDVAAGRAGGALEGMRALGLAGLSVTMPHKDDVARAVDERSAEAELLGAVNCVVPIGGGRLRGENTDGPGFVASLRDVGVDPAGLRCCVLGAGGAARSVVLALARAGAAEVAVVNRTESKAAAAVALAGSAGRLGASPGDADLVVNATSVGMGAGGGLAVDPALLGAGQVVVDLVYEPRETPLLRAARGAGATAVGGIGMLLHQAALAFELWTGEAAPLQAMRAVLDGPPGTR